MGRRKSLPSSQKHFQRKISKDSTGKSVHPRSQNIWKIEDRCNKTRTQDPLTMDTPLTIHNNLINIQPPNLKAYWDGCIMNSRWRFFFFLPSIQFYNPFIQFLFLKAKKSKPEHIKIDFNVIQWTVTSFTFHCVFPVLEIRSLTTTIFTRISPHI